MRFFGPKWLESRMGQAESTFDLQKKGADPFSALCISAGRSLLMYSRHHGLRCFTKKRSIAP
jgi:hypothetical protein